MTPEEWLLDETRQWVLRASNDLRAAEICVSELPAEALYHCQQTAEKLLKGFLTWNQKPIRKTHELGELAAACAEIDATLGLALEPAIALSQYAWRFRYPGAPYEPDADEAGRGLALARLVRTEIGKRLPKAAMGETGESE
jgi:HEPN domain-containing protein